jgi:hypothetical protein
VSTLNAATTRTQTSPRRTRQAIAQQKFLRRRQKLAAILESELDPRYPLRHGLRSWARIPSANRATVAEPLQEIVTLLRDPATTVSERTLRRVLAFVTDPASPAYGQYPTQAGFAAQALADDVRAHAQAHTRSSPAPGARGVALSPSGCA